MIRSKHVKKLVLGGACVAVAGASLLIPVGGGSASQLSATAPRSAGPVSLAEFSSDPPRAKLPLLFIHHSVGGALLADSGDKQRIAEEIWRSHPNGGGLRRLLEGQGYEVHEASYGSDIGGHTDRGDWLPKFRDKMQVIRTCALNDQRLPDGQQNKIVVFKSCFPENMLSDDAAVARAREDLSALLPVIAAHPDMLFIYMTTPPLAPKVRSEPAWKWLARKIMGKPLPGPRLLKSGPGARRLNDWVVSPEGWLKDYPLKNLVVFDLFDTLTNHGKSDFLEFATDDGYDSHPSRAGNELVAAEFVPFLNRAVRRAGLAEQR